MQVVRLPVFFEVLIARSHTFNLDILYASEQQTRSSSRLFLKSKTYTFYVPKYANVAKALLKYSTYYSVSTVEWHLERTKQKQTIKKHSCVWQVGKPHQNMLLCLATKEPWDYNCFYFRYLPLTWKVCKGVWAIGLWDVLQPVRELLVERTRSAWYSSQVLYRALKHIFMSETFLAAHKLVWTVLRCISVL